ncbi:MAG: beta-lactamase family protein [Bacteroidetes bacterium]|nr:beta-lactamase family protein [Bacteroidota bacterium]
MKHLNRLVSLILMTVLFVCCSEEKDLSTKKETFVPQIDTLNLTNSIVAEKIDTFFSNRFKNGRFNGTVLYGEKNHIIYNKAFGYSNFESKTPLTIDSKFQLASVSKTFTSYAVMLLKQRGQLSYQDSVRYFFPDFPYENITIHQLLIHRSGLPEYMHFTDEYWLKNNPDSTITNKDVLDILIKIKPTASFRPGVRYNYNNTNYCMLALIIEKVSGMPYSVFMKKEIFEPLGLKDTEVYNKSIEPQNSHIVRGYIGRRRTANNSYQNGVVGDKGIYSSAIDMFKFNRALFEGVFVNKKELEEAYKLGHEELRENDNYGHGWRINKRPDSTKIVYHAGWWKGFRSYFIRDLASEKCIVVLTNRSNGGVLHLKELMELIGSLPESKDKNK